MCRKSQTKHDSGQLGRTYFLLPLPSTFLPLASQFVTLQSFFAHLSFHLWSLSNYQITLLTCVADPKSQLFLFSIDAVWPAELPQQFVSIFGLLPARLFPTPSLSLFSPHHHLPLIINLNKGPDPKHHLPMPEQLSYSSTRSVSLFYRKMQSWLIAPGIQVDKVYHCPKHRHPI